MSFDTARVYRYIRDDVLVLWSQSWKRPDISVYWRRNDPLPTPDPLNYTNFFRNEVQFGIEEINSFGGRGHSIHCQYGSVIMRSFSALLSDSEDESLSLLSNAMAAFRNHRMLDQWGGFLSFIGSGEFDFGPTEDGVWFMRSCLATFEYRFEA